MKFSIENGFFIPSPFLAAEKQGLGLKFSNENEYFKPIMRLFQARMVLSCVGNGFSCVRARFVFSISGPSGIRNTRTAKIRTLLSFVHGPVLLFLGLFEYIKENFKNTKVFSHLANP